MARMIAALISGTLFGLGLTISGMVNPAKVIGFLDIFGQWDPTLALVMGGAVLVTLVAFPFILRSPRPLFDEKFAVPTTTDLDAKLVGGASIFGVGWGLAGFCPGPAVTAMATGRPTVFIFVAAMLAGMLIHGLVFDRQPRGARTSAGPLGSQGRSRA